MIAPNSGCPKLKFSEAEKITRGQELLKYYQRALPLMYSCYTEVYLHSHPFDLPIPNGRKIEVMHRTGVTDTNTTLMLTRINMIFSGCDEVTSLRIIYAQVDNRQPSFHNVYFEVGVISGVSIMCCGCTDYSGTGGAAKNDMECVFAYLSSISKINIEVCETSTKVTARAERTIDEAVAKKRTKDVIENMAPLMQWRP